MGIGQTGRDVAVETQKQRPRNVVGARIGNAHVLDRRGGGADLLPQIERLEHAAHAGGQGRGPRIGRHGEIPLFKHGHRKIGLEGGKARGERQPDRAAPDNDHIEIPRFAHFRHP